MKLIRFGKSGQEKPGVELDNGQRLDVSGFCDDYDENFYTTDGVKNLEFWLERNGDEPSKWPEVFKQTEQSEEEDLQEL